MSTVHVLYDGYSYIKNNKFYANCTCSLIKGPQNVIVDTMTAWDKDKIIEGLSKHNLTPSDIHYCVGTHSHSDHVGNLNLFLNAMHIVGFTVSKENVFFEHDFYGGEKYVINENVWIVPTPGHTADDVTVYVKAENNLVYAIAGDIFEKFEDLEADQLWQSMSLNVQKQSESRKGIIRNSDVIVPGHGPQFEITQAIREKFS